MTAENIAEQLHDVYENSAKIAGWETQKKCQVPFKDLPEENKNLMVGMGHFVLGLVEEKCKEQREACAEKFNTPKDVSNKNNYIDIQAGIRKVIKETPLVI